MYLQNLKIRNFRNYHAVDLHLDPAVNIFFGENAQGKTNLIEAVSVLTLGRSFRTHRDEDLIRRGEDGFYLKGDFKNEDLNLTIEIGNDRERSLVRLNGVIHKKRRDVFGRVKVVIFSPDDLQIIKGGPGHRRDYLDLYIAQNYPAYRRAYQNYHRALFQRNSLLKKAHFGRNIPTLDAWTEQLIEEGSKVLYYRLMVIKEIAPWVNQYHRQISGGKEEVALVYIGQATREGVTDQSMIKEEFYRILQEKKGEELRRGMTLVGPHRDDFSIIMNKKWELRSYGSQGQQRTAALALKMAMINLIKNTDGENPLLLLDDVFSEFDNDRKKKLLKLLMSKTQTLITTANLRIKEEFGPDFKFFRVEGGGIV